MDQHDFISCLLNVFLDATKKCNEFRIDIAMLCYREKQNRQRPKPQKSSEECPSGHPRMGHCAKLSKLSLTVFAWIPTMQWHSGMFDVVFLWQCVTFESFIWCCWFFRTATGTFSLVSSQQDFISNNRNLFSKVLLNVQILHAQSKCIEQKKKYTRFTFRIQLIWCQT